jgi:MFS family permease
MPSVTAMSLPHPKLPTPHPTSLGLTYYGTILIAPQFFNESDDPIKFNYPALFISSTAEVIGCTIGFLLIDRVGRKSLAGWAYAACGVCTAILMASRHMSQGVGIFVLMLARGAIFIGTSTTWVVTPELYPTYVRAAGHSWCSALSRAAAFATPYWGNAKSVPLSMRLLLYSLVNTVAACASFLLPKETAGQALADD